MMPRIARATRGKSGWIVGLAAVLGAAVAGKADEPKGLRWVGPEAFLYAESARPDTFLDRTMSDRVTHLLKAVPAYEATMARTDVKLGLGVANFVAAGLGTTPEKALRDVAGGGIVFAAEGAKGPERVFLVITPRDLGFLEKSHAKLIELARLDAKAKGKPDPVKEAEHRGIKGYSLAPTEAHAIVDGALVVANGPETLKQVIDRALDGKTPTLADDGAFSARRREQDPAGLAWAFVRTDRLRQIDPKRFAGKGPDGGAVFLFGPWLEAIRKGDWATLGLTWTEDRLAAELTGATPKDGYSPAMKRFFPPKGEGATRPLRTPNLIASGALWRDLASIWEVRADFLPPETVQNLAQLDTTAGTFFGGRDFGTGVLGALGERWRLVVADQDFAAMEQVPDLKLPAFALVLELKPGDDEFADRLMAAFQSFIGLVNLGAAQSKAPPLMIGSEKAGAVTIATSRYLPETARPAGEPIHSRHNFSPSAARVGNTFFLSSSLGLARDLVQALKEPAEATESVLVAEADGPALSRLIERNRGYLVTQNMLEKGNAKSQAEGEIGLLIELVKTLGHATMTVEDRADSFVLKLNHDLVAPSSPERSLDADGRHPAP